MIKIKEFSVNKSFEILEFESMEELKSCFRLEDLKDLNIKLEQCIDSYDIIESINKELYGYKKFELMED